MLCCSHRCHLPAGGGVGTEAAAPHSDHPREQLQEVTREGQPSSGVCHWGWGPEPSPGKEGSSKLTTKLQTVAPGGPGRRSAHPALQCSWCVCWWACLVLMLGTEETSWLLSRMVKFNLFLLDIPTQRKKKKRKKNKINNGEGRGKGLSYSEEDVPRGH